MGWLDKVKAGMAQATDQAGEMAAIGKLKMEIRSLHGKMTDIFQEIGAKVYDLSEEGTTFPSAIASLCKAADKLADEIKAKEKEIDKIKAD